ncbi:MAG: hypothetical protein Kow00121_60900 [Elainellaceae cyanobacterium]
MVSNQPRKDGFIAMLFRDENSNAEMSDAEISNGFIGCDVYYGHCCNIPEFKLEM